MVNGVPWEVPSPHAPRVLAKEFSRESIHHDTPKDFPHIFILLASRASIWNFLQPMEFLGSIMVNVHSMKV